MRKILKGEDRRFKLGEFCLGLQFDFRHETIISNDKTKNPPKKKWSSMVPPPPKFQIFMLSCFLLEKKNPWNPWDFSHLQLGQNFLRHWCWSYATTIARFRHSTHQLKNGWVLYGFIWRAPRKEGGRLDKPQGKRTWRTAGKSQHFI